MVCVLKRRDFVQRYIQRFQKVNGRCVERGAEGNQAALFGVFENRRVPFPARIGFLIEFIQVFVGPQRLIVADIKFLRLSVEGDGIRGIRLEFDGMGAGVGRCIDDGQRTFQRLVVIGEDVLVCCQHTGFT